MRAGTGRRSARARGKKVRNRKTFRQTTTPQRNQIRKTASTHGGRFLFLAGCTKGRNAGVGSPHEGMIPDPCRGGAGGARKPGTRAGDTQIGDTEAHRTETRRRGDANGPATGKNAANQEDPLPYFVPEFRPLRTLQTKGPVAKTTGPRFNVRCGYSSAATGSSVAAADSHDEQSVHSPAGSAHAAGSETAAGSPAGSSVTARNSASSVWSS